MKTRDDQSPRTQDNPASDKADDAFAKPGMLQRWNPILRWRLNHELDRFSELQAKGVAIDEERFTYVCRMLTAMTSKRQFENVKRAEEEKQDLEEHGSIEYQDMSLLALWINGQIDHRPYARPFSRHGLARWLAVVFGVLLVGLIGQIIWMWQTLAVTDPDLWLWELAYIAPAPVRYWLVVQQLQQPINALLFTLAFGSWIAFTVMRVKSRVTRIWLGASQLWLLLIVTMVSGQVIGRAFLYERAKAGGGHSSRHPG